MTLALVPGPGNPDLATAIACALGETTPCLAERFPDGELRVALGPVRGADVYVVQGTHPPAHDHLVELFLLADAARRAGAARVTAVIPYLAYARQDRRSAEGEGIGARTIADHVSGCVDRVVVMDLHADPVEGFFSCPVEHLSAVPLLAERVRGIAAGRVVVAPDLGATKRAGRYAALLGSPVATVRKRRLSGREVEAIGVDGDVDGRDVIVVDDMISTGGTIVAAVRAVRAAGARRAAVVATHALLVPPADELLASLELDAITVADTVPVPTLALPRLDIVSVAPLFGDVIGRLHRQTPLAELITQT